MNKIEDVILSVEELNRKKKCKLKKLYNNDQLKDQQIILMLMAKKTTVSAAIERADETNTLNYFLEIFDGIPRLAHLYLK
jgi:hypothetical protein